MSSTILSFNSFVIWQSFSAPWARRRGEKNLYSSSHLFVSPVEGASCWCWLSDEGEEGKVIRGIMKKFPEPKLIFNKFSVFGCKASENKLAFIYSSRWKALEIELPASSLHGKHVSASQKQQHFCGDTRCMETLFSHLFIELNDNERRVVRDEMTCRSLQILPRRAMTRKTPTLRAEDCSPWFEIINTCRLILPRAWRARG